MRGALITEQPGQHAALQEQGQGRLEKPLTLRPLCVFICRVRGLQYIPLMYSFQLLHNLEPRDMGLKNRET